MDRIVAREHRPIRRFITLVFVALVSAAMAGAYFIRAPAWTRASDAQLSARVAHLEAEVAESAAALAQMRQTITVNARTRQVEELAYTRIEADLAALQTQKLALEEEVAFYRGIVASSKAQRLKVRRLFVFPEGQTGAYRFQVVLTRNVKDDKVLSGSLSLSVAGEQGGEARRIPATALLDRGNREFEFSFRYFHRLEGRFALPPEFVPHRVHVHVKVPGEVPADTEKTFDWVVTTG